VLTTVRTPDGRPAFAEIVPREVAYPGPHCQRAPGLLMVPADESIIVTADVSGPVWRPSWQTGLHRYQGMWLQASPRVRPGRLAAPVRIVDMVPKLLTDLGLRTPASVHGRPVAAALAGDVAVPPPLPERAGDPTTTATGDSAAEDAYTAARLREMGYL